MQKYKSKSTESFKQLLRKEHIYVETLSSCTEVVKCFVCACVVCYIHFVPPPSCKSSPSVDTNSNWLHNSTQSSPECCYKLKCIIISKASNFWMKWQRWWESYKCSGTLSSATKTSLRLYKSVSNWILDYLISFRFS